MSQKKLDTITNGGVVNDLPHFEIPNPEDLLSSVGENLKSKAPLYKPPVALKHAAISRKRDADTVIDKDEFKREIKRLRHEYVEDLAKKLTAAEERIKNLELDLASVRATVRQQEEGLNYVRGCCKVTYCFVKKAEAAHIVPGWTPMKQTYNFSGPQSQQ